MAEFYSNTRKPSRKREDFTNRLQPVYRKEIDKKTGETRLVKDRDVDIFEKIQAYAEETKLSNILSRYNVNMLQRVKDGETQMVDLTNLPDNLLEAMVTIDNAKYLWERQSPDFKVQFDNDFRKFIAGSENGQIMDILTKQFNVAKEKFDVSKQANVESAKVETPVTQTIKIDGGISTNV